MAPPKLKRNLFFVFPREKKGPPLFIILNTLKRYYRLSDGRESFHWLLSLGQV